MDILSHKRTRDGFRCCSKCNEWKPATTEYYQRNARASDGLYHRCKICHNKPPKVSDIPEGYKRCSSCKDDFPATSEFFHSHKARSDGLNGMCKTCACNKTKEYGIRNKERDSEEVIANRSAEKQCRACKTLFPATSEYFHRDMRQKDGFVTDCRICVNNRMKEYYKRPDVRERSIATQKVRNLRPGVRERNLASQRKRYYRHLAQSREKNRLYMRALYARKKAAQGRYAITPPIQALLSNQVVLPQDSPQDKLHYVYILKYPEDYLDQQKAGIVFYVGKGMHDRVYRHEQEARRGAGDYKHRVIRKIWKQGKQISKEILAFFETHEEAIQYEIALIFFMDGLSNRTYGGEGVLGLKHSEEARRKISLSGMGRPSPMKGKPMSEEHKRKLRKPKRRRKTESQNTNVS